MLFEYFGCKAEGALIREAVDASLDANVRTPEIQMEGGAILSGGRKMLGGRGALPCVVNPYLGCGDGALV